MCVFIEFCSLQDCLGGQSTASPGWAAWVMELVATCILTEVGSNWRHPEGYADVQLFSSGLFGRARHSLPGLVMELVVSSILAEVGTTCRLPKGYANKSF